MLTRTDVTAATTDTPAGGAPPAPPAAAPARPRWRHVVGAVGRHVGLIVLFALPAVALWWHAWDGHLASRLTCMCGDPGQEVWFVAWPAYALAHLKDPLFTHALYYPQGANLLNSTSGMAMGTMVAPVTWLFGPVAATNVLLTLAPALSAWGCWVAARRFTSWWPAAVMAALVFGYAPFLVDNTAWGDGQVTLLVVPPLALVCGYELAWSQRGAAWRWGVALGLLVTVQFFISTEVLALMAAVGAVGAVVWLVLSWNVVHTKLAYLARGGAWAAGVGLALCAYPTWFALHGPRAVHGAPWSVVQYDDLRLGDLWNPGRYGAHASGVLKFTNYEGLQGPHADYLGPLILAAAVVGAVLAFRRRLTKVLVVSLVATVVLALGTNGHRDDWLPWHYVTSLPLLGRAAPLRLMVAVDLFVALLIALGADVAWARWKARAPGRGWHGPAWTATVVAVVVGLWAGGMAMIFQTFQVPLTTVPVRTPAWYATVGARIPPGSVVLSYPFPMAATGKSQAMVWQAQDALRFNLVGGYVEVPNGSGTQLHLGAPESAYETLGALSLFLGWLPVADPPTIANLRAAIARWHVDWVVVTNTSTAPVYATAMLTAVLGRPPTVSHGAWVWDLRVHPVPAATPVSLAAASLALQDCVPQPRFGRAPAGRPLPMALPRCVAAQIAAGN